MQDELNPLTRKQVIEVLQFGAFFIIIKTRFALAGKLIYCSDNSKHIYLSLLLSAFMFSVIPVCFLSPLQTMTCFIVTRSKWLNTRSIISTVLFQSFSLQHSSLFCAATTGYLSKILEKQLFQRLSMSSSLSSSLCPTLLTANSTKPMAPLGSSDRFHSLTFHGWILKVFFPVLMIL